ALVASCPFSFHGPATPALYTLSLHDALPILAALAGAGDRPITAMVRRVSALGENNTVNLEWGAPLPGVPCGSGYPYRAVGTPGRDRKSTRLNSSHVKISYAVFCLKKKNRTHA